MKDLIMTKSMETRREVDVRVELSIRSWAACDVDLE